MKRNSTHPRRRGGSLAADSSFQSSRIQYQRAFSAARAMRFWCPRSAGKFLGTAAFAAALTLGSSAAQAQFPASFDLSTLDGSNGFVINGVDRGDQSGWSVSSAGDVNGDGVDDLIIGARSADPNGNNSAGESYVVFGNSGIFPASINLSMLNGSNGFALRGIDPFDVSGQSVSGAGDINGDGFDDVIVGASGGNPGGRPNAGESYVVFGDSGSFPASLNLSTLNGTNGFVLNGISGGLVAGLENGDNSGWSVSAAGDFNGDGFDDLIIGAHNADRDAGESYLVFGNNGNFGPSFDLSTLDGTNGFAINGIDIGTLFSNGFGGGDNSGFSVSGAGDVNGDGFDDVIVGAYTADPNGIARAGESYVVFGDSGGFSPSLDLSILDGTNGFALNGIEVGDRTGTSVSGAGDVNGDGFDDLIVGGPDADPGGVSRAGESYVVLGGGGGFAASLDLGSLDGTNGFVINGISGSDSSGRSVSGAGDVNGDGIDDLIIGARGGDPNGSSNAGESYVVFGDNAVVASSLDLSDLDGTNGFVLNGVSSFSYSGTSVSGAGDVNGDGIDDLLIGAPSYGTRASQSYVVFGRSSVAVPEPSGTSLMAAGILGWFTRRKRQQLK